MRRAGWSLLLLAGCASQAAPASIPVASPVAVAGPVASAPASASAHQAPTPLPVVAPASLLVEARTRPLRQIADELGKASGAPLGAVLTALAPGALRTDAGLGAVVLLDSTEEDPFETLMAFSVPVTSDAEFARAVEGAGWRRAGVGYKAPARLEGLFCKTADALGDAPLRAVCGSSERDVNQCAPYLVRGLPLAELGEGDLRVKLRFSPAKGMAGNDLTRKRDELSALFPFFLGVDPALAEAPTVIFDELSRFLDAQESVALGASIDGDKKRLLLSGQWRWSSRDAWGVQLLTSKREPAPAPAIFGRLPAESSIALFGRGVDAALLARPRRAIRSVLGFMVGVQKTIPSEAMFDVIDALPQGDEPWTAALVEGESPWFLLGFEADAAAMPGWARKVGALLKAAGRGASAGSRPAVRVDEAPAGFPPRSVLLDLGPGADDMPEIFGPRAPSKRRPSILLVASPGATGQSWVALGTDREAMKSALRRAAAREPRGTLAALSELDALRAEKAGFGGMVSPRGLALRARSEAASKAVQASPSGFASPVWFTGTASDKAIEVRAAVEQKTLADLASLRR